MEAVFRELGRGLRFNRTVNQSLRTGLIEVLAFDFSGFLISFCPYLQSFYSLPDFNHPGEDRYSFREAWRRGSGAIRFLRDK
jgi:hypothetical protein